MNYEISQSKNVLIVGGGHGIGLALTKELLSNHPHLKVFTTYRDEAKAQELINLQKDYSAWLEVMRVDPTVESEVLSLVNNFKERELQLDLIINCVGFLHDKEHFPEKSLKDINAEQLIKSFKINAIPTVIMAKNFEKLLSKKEASSFVTLSAKVGSIEDNRMGGWYSYRSSKSALNMLLKNISIEFKRKRIPCNVLSIHPGTTETELSRPFIENFKLKIHQMDETAKNILSVIDDLPIDKSGSFLSWDGEELPW